jgi:hypothetical protein
MITFQDIWEKNEASDGGTMAVQVKKELHVQ